MLAWVFKAGVSTIRKIVYETCTYIWEELHSSYLAVPNLNEFQSIADNFYSKSGMPCCLGAIDGKHINIVCPRRSGSVFYNYKQRYSIVLLASCDSNYVFPFIDVGAVGSKSDGGVFANSVFGRKIINEDRVFPIERPLPGTNELFPYYFVSDAAFPLRKNVMRPYPGRLLNRKKQTSTRSYQRHVFLLRTLLVSYQIGGEFS